MHGGVGLGMGVVWGSGCVTTTTGQTKQPGCICALMDYSENQASHLKPKQPPPPPPSLAPTDTTPPSRRAFTISRGKYEQYENTLLATQNGPQRVG